MKNLTLACGEGIVSSEKLLCFLSRGQMRLGMDRLALAARTLRAISAVQLPTSGRPWGPYLCVLSLESAFYLIDSSSFPSLFDAYLYPRLELELLLSSVQNE